MPTIIDTEPGDGLNDTIDDRGDNISRAKIMTGDPTVPLNLRMAYHQFFPSGAIGVIGVDIDPIEESFFEGG